MANFLNKARKSMEKKGTVGAFTKSSEHAGQSVQAHAKSVLANPDASAKQKKRAAFAKAMHTIAERRKGK